MGTKPPPSLGSESAASVPTLPRPAPASTGGRGQGWRLARAEPPRGERGRARGSGRARNRRRVGDCGALDERRGPALASKRGGRSAGAGWRVCGRERVSARVCARPAPARPRPRAPLPAPRPLPAAPSPPPPAPRSSPAPGISAAVAVQAADSSSPSLGRLSARSERAAPRSSAHWSRPVSPGPSRGQPRGVASRPTRPAAEEREEDGTPAPPPPYPREVGRGPEAGRCQLTGAASRAGSGAAGGGARAQAGRTPLPRRCPTPGERRGGRETAEPGRGRRGEPGPQCFRVLGRCGAGVGGLLSEVAAHPRCAPRPPSFIPGRIGAESSFLPPPPLPSSWGPLRGGGCGVGRRKGIFSGALPLAPAGGERGRR